MLQLQMPATYEVKENNLLTFVAGFYKGILHYLSFILADFFVQWENVLINLSNLAEKRDYNQKSNSFKGVVCSIV